MTEHMFDTVAACLDLCRPSVSLSQAWCRHRRCLSSPTNVCSLSTPVWLLCSQPGIRLRLREVSYAVRPWSARARRRSHALSVWLQESPARDHGRRSSVCLRSEFLRLRRSVCRSSGRSSSGLLMERRRVRSRAISDLPCRLSSTVWIWWFSRSASCPVCRLRSFDGSRAEPSPREAFCSSSANPCRHRSTFDSRRAPCTGRASAKDMVTSNGVWSQSRSTAAAVRGSGSTPCGFPMQLAV